MLLVEVLGLGQEEGQEELLELEVEQSVLLELLEMLVFWLFGILSRGLWCRVLR